MNGTKASFPEILAGPSVLPPGASLRKYREVRQRIDYYPSQEARDAIDRLHQHYPAHPIRQMIDALVLEGIKAFTRRP